MNKTTRAEVLVTLEQEWGTYVPRFHLFAPDLQAAWVASQGYTRFADILAHVVAWWGDALQVIDQMLHNPHLDAPTYDDIGDALAAIVVDDDAFNAAAVARFATLGEAEVIQAFEATRAAFVDLVTNLPEAAYENPKIADRLRIEVIRHLCEHELPLRQP